MATIRTLSREEKQKNARRLRLLVRRSRSLAPLSALTGMSLTWRAALLAGTMLSAHVALAQSSKLPQGGQVVAGGAAIAQPTANQMVITQSTQRAAINWQSFNIGAGYGVQFVQPSSTAIAVNRVIGLGGPSQILGTLTANGQVYIVNPQGVVFGKGSVVNTGALVATTRDLDLQQFMAGGNITLSGGSTGNGRVVNKGTITTDAGGYVVLAGDRVVNKGEINTPGGRTVLAAGDQATVALSNGQLVNVTMNAAVANATVKNGGVIKAAGGKVVLSANGANSVLGGAVNLTGSVDVSAALAGDITVDAGPGGTVNATGATLKAVSTAGKGGNITLAGARVGMFGGTQLNASGTTGGGTVLAGGGAHGANAEVRNATATVLDPTSSIDASATDRGDGGTVVLWSEAYTGFYGTILAQGGPNGGNGGWVETSSKDNLQAIGSVDARGLIGQGGLWLLDPTNVTIAASANASESFNASNGTWTPNNSLNATINVAALNAQLSNGTSITITTASSCSSGTGNININASISKTGGGNASLTLTANGAINDNGANISSTAGTLNVTMRANGSVTLANGSAFFLNGGSLNITGGNATNTLVGVNIGQITINAAAAIIAGTTNSALFAVNQFGTLNASGTTLLTINGTGGSNASVNFGAAVATNDLTVNAVAKGNGTGIVVGATLTAAGNVTLNGTGNGVGSGSGVDVSAAVIAQNGAIRITGTGNGSFGVGLFGSASAAGNIVINGSSNSGIAVNVAGTVNASAGNVTINGTSSTGRAVRLSGTIAASGTVNVTGSADDANGIAVPGNLTLAAAGGATLTGTANTANGINISAVLNAAGTPLLTLNGTSNSAGGGNATFYGVNISGAVNAANLTVIGRGLSAVDDVGGMIVSGTLNATGDVAIDASANNGIAVNVAGTVNASGGNLTINGTSVTGRGVRLSGTVAASGIVNITGRADDANGIAVPGNLTLAAGGGATLTGAANTANGINISGVLNAAGTPLLTLNGTSNSASGGNASFYGVNVSGTVNAANLAIVGRGMSAVDDIGGTTVIGVLNAAGDITIVGSANSGIAVNLTGTVNAAGGNVTINGTSSTGRGVRFAGTIAASGTVNITGRSDNANGLVVPSNLSAALTAGGGATLIGTANAANGINISGVLNAGGTPVLTLNGTSNSASGGNASFYGVNISGTVNAADLAVNGLGNLSATGDVGGTSVSGTVNAAGNVTLNGQSNGTFSGIFFTGGVFSTGNVVLNGAGGAKYGVNASGTLNAGGSVTINGTSNGTIGVLFDTNLTLAANGGAAVNARSNSTNGFFFEGVLNAAGAPMLTINGTTATANSGYYGVSFAGNASVANLTLSGLGNLSASGDVGGTTFNGTAIATGNVTVNGQSNGTFSGVFFTGTIASGGNVVLNGSGVAKYGVNASGTLNAAGTVTISGTSAGTAGVLLNTSLNLAASGGATIIARSNSTNGFFFAGLLNASNTPQLTINGTSAASGGGYYGVAFTGNATVAKLALNGVGNLSATGNVGGTTFNGTASATGDVALNGQSNGGLPAVSFAGGILSCGSIVLNGTGGRGYGVNASGTLNAAGPVTITGRANAGVGVFVGGSLTLGGSQGGTIAGTTDSGLYGVSFASDSVLTAAGPLVVNGTGIEASGCLSSAGNMTFNANLVTLNGAVFQGSGANVVLQALDAASPLSVNGSGANFGNVASVLIGGTNQAAALNLAAPLTYAGTGNLGVVTGAASILLNGNINASAGSGSVVLSAGNGVPLNASQSNGNVTGGDVVVGGASSLVAGAGGTVVIYSGNANSASFAPLVANGATSQTKFYATLAGAGAVCTSSALNLFYRVVPNATLTLGNATGANVSKTYDGTGVALGYGVTGLIDGDSASSVTMTGGSLASSLPLDAGQALHAGNYTISQGTATFSADHNYGLSVSNGAIAISRAALTVTAQTDSKVYDGTTAASAIATVCGTIVGDSFTGASLAESYSSIHVLGAGNSTLNVAAPLTNASFATSTAGSRITDYDVSYVTASGTITPRPLSVTATSGTKMFDGTTSSSALMTVSGNIAGDIFTTASRAEVYASAAAAGPGNSILLPATPLTNASFAASTAGSFITDYAITYSAALGTITALPTATVIPPPNQLDGSASSAVLSLGSWLNSGGLQQNLPAGLALNDNVMHLIFTTSGSGQPLIQASWAFFDSNFSGTINLPANVSP